MRSWVSGDDGATFVLKELMSSTEDNDHPRLVAQGADNYVVWRTERDIHVRKIAW